MELKNVFGEVIFTLEGAKTVFELITAAVAAKKSLNDASLVGASLDGANLVDASLVDARLRGASLDGASLDGARLDRASLDGKKILSLRVISYSAYRWQIQAVLFQDGSRWVRMGCLFKSLEDWEKCGGIRKSNLLAYPDDGSERSEERAAAFEFAKAAVLRMKFPESEKQ